MQDKNHWQAMYLGAIAALNIRNVDMAATLAELTRSDEEAIHVIGLLQAGKEGDRVWPARAWLNAQRSAEDGGTHGECIDVRALSRALDTLSAHSCTIDAALKDYGHSSMAAMNVRIAIRRIIDGFRSAETQEGS
jgi:predicted deacetylase